jgi:hypothetical protein
MVMMQTVRTTPMAPSEAGMRSLRMSHAIVRDLLVLSLLKPFDKLRLTERAIQIRKPNTRITKGNRRATIVEAEKIAILTKTVDLGELRGNETVCELSSVWKSSRNTDTFFPKIRAGSFRFRAATYRRGERLASTCSHVSAARSGSAITG